MTHWSEQFLGLPYEPLGRSVAGVDCFGLVWLVYAAQGVSLPSYAGDYASPEERGEVAGLIDGAKSDWVRVFPAKELDLVTFSRGGIESHIGVVVKSGLMLHVAKGKLSCIEDYTSGMWASRLTGIWRHVSLI